MMEFTTKEISTAVDKARRAITVKEWTRDDFDDEVTDETVQAFAGHVMSYYGKAILETLITDKAAEEVRDLVLVERKLAGLR